MSRRVPPEGSTFGEPTGRAIDNLVDSIFADLPRSYWWKILPSNLHSASDYNICTGTGRPWDDLLPLLLDGGYLKCSNRSNLSEYDVMRPQFELMVNRLTSQGGLLDGVRVELTTYRQLNMAGGSNALYIHIGEIIWPKPETQIRKKKKPTNLELRRLDPFITEEIRSTIKRIDINSRMEALWAKYGRKIEIAIIKEKIQELIGSMDNEDLLKDYYEFEPDTIISAAQVAAEGIEDEVEEVEVVQIEAPAGFPPPIPPPGFTTPPARRPAATTADDDKILADADLQFMLEKREREINFALGLDLQRSPRLSRSGNEPIMVHGRVQASEEERQRILTRCYYWGYQDPHRTPEDRLRIAKAACRVTAYDHGFRGSLAHTQVKKWDAILMSSYETGENAADCLSPKHSGSIKYVEDIEKRHPRYIRELFRYATKLKGSGALYQELADTMNLKSEVPGETRATLNLSRWQLVDWFKDKKQNGKHVSSKEKPMLTLDMKTGRLVWIDENGAILTDRMVPIAMLDEKWFYKRNRRRVLKELPPDDLEDPKECKLKRPKATSRRFPVKIMYMGVVARPRPDKEFDGKILLKRVAKDKVRDRVAYSERFVAESGLNESIKGGCWKEAYSNGTPISELRQVVIDTYGIDDRTGDRLIFRYKTFYGKTGKSRWNLIDDNDCIEEVVYCPTEAEETSPLSIEQVQMMVQYDKGDIMEEDINCNSQFMLDNIDEIGEAIRAKFWWVQHEEQVFLFMDNAGGRYSCCYRRVHQDFE